MRAIVMLGAIVVVAASVSWSAERPQFDTRAERIGGLRLEMPARELGAVLQCGRPAQGKEEYEGATGLFVQTWRYAGCGVTLRMHSESRGGKKAVAAITVTAPSRLAAGRGIRIGSPEAAVDQAYGRFRDPDESRKGSRFVAGSIYDGLVFDFAGGRVVRMFLGAGAE